MLIAGTDEAGRGPLAGPVVAAAAVLTREQREMLVSEGLRDSKKMPGRLRDQIFARICEMGVVWRAQAASPLRIDTMNILNASLWCMASAVGRLPLRPDLVLVDGNRPIPYLACDQKCVIGGDGIVPSIAAASVIAKVLRDRVMSALDSLYPGYGFAAHKGYPTRAHIKALAELGPCAAHRMSFAPIAQRGAP